MRLNSKDLALATGQEIYQKFLQTSATDPTWAALGPLRVRFGCLKPGRPKKRPLAIPCNRHRHANKRYFYALRAVLRPRLHPNIFHIRRRGAERVVIEIFKARAKGFIVVHIDIESAFKNVDIGTLTAILRDLGISVNFDWLCGLGDYEVVNSHKRIAGLPQGFSTSPILFAAFIDPIVRQMNKYFWTIAYADDLLIFVKSGAAAKDAIRYLKKLLDRHSGDQNPDKSKRKPSKKLQVNTKQGKEPIIVGPDQELKVLGFVFPAEFEKECGR